MRTPLQRLLLLFWSLYFLFVTASNLVDALQQLGWAPEAWSFTSGNFGMIAETVGEYGLSRGLAAILFALVILLESASTVFFAMALRDSVKDEGTTTGNQSRAFVCSIGLFAGFIVADELFVVYHRVSGLETTHFLVMCALLLSVLVTESQSMWSRPGSA